MVPSIPCVLRRIFVAAICWLVAPSMVAQAQPSGIPVIRDSSVGYIDSAIPGDILRLRFDAAYDNFQPSRAEFFYPRSGAEGPGPRLPETSVDYQEASLYAERAWSELCSTFINAPARWINPEVNDNASGFGDLDAGFKYALTYTPQFYTTAQLRVYAPTGHAREGLGTRHVSLEPALLGFSQITERIGLEGELRYWIPVDGTDFAGDMFRYGIGASYWLPLRGKWQISPVAEFVGWTILGGKSSQAVAPDLFVIEDEQGTTLVHAKLGARARLGRRADVYAGYGRPLTGEAWYQNTFRIELRYNY